MTLLLKVNLSISCCSVLYILANDDVNVMADSMSKVLYECGRKCENRSSYDRNIAINLSTWERPIQDKNDCQVWRAIDWKGNVIVKGRKDENRQSDEDFQKHFEAVLNPDQGTQNFSNIDTNLTILILDDLVTVQELEHQIQKIKPDKACGLDGLSPGVLSMLRAHWILTPITLFNNVLLSGHYPTSWTKAKLLTVFKKK